jgi:LysR family transcriptional regulator, glycine cleavage system transcriptional activator
MVNRRLPPLNALRAFEVAARTTNFTLAARELHVSQGAVSRHVAQLEAHLGLKLFHRHHRKVKLTAEGAQYAQTIRAAFDQMDEATRLLRRTDRPSPLRIRLFPTVAIKWFVPRLGRFHARHPEIDVQTTTTASPVRFDAEDVDFTIQMRQSPQEGVRYDKLFGVELLPVCCGELRRRLAARRAPEDLLREPLLHSMQRPRDWQTWFEAASIAPAAIRDGLTFGNSALAYQAAIDGSGIAIAHRQMVQDDLASGRLVPASELIVAIEEAYYLVSRATDNANPNAGAFSAWILSEAAECPPYVSSDSARDSRRRHAVRKR